jgi:hypothetical protein
VAAGRPPAAFSTGAVVAMGDECACEQCRGRDERALGAGEWPIGLREAPASQSHECLLVVREGGISICLSPPGAGARAGLTSSMAVLL